MSSDHTALAEEKRWIELSKKDIRHFEPIYTKYYERLFRYFFRRTDNEELSGELCSNTFYRALSGIGKYEWRGIPVGGWLFKIAANELKKYYRDKREVFLIEADKMAQQSMASDPVGLSEDQWILIFTHLSEDELRLVEMRYFEGNTFREISQLLDLKESTVKMRIYRLLAKLKNLIEQIHDQV